MEEGKATEKDDPKKTGNALLVGRVKRWRGLKVEEKLKMF